ncbi:MAG: pantoate--beta-alanine ligase [Myxococcales bacterium]|nr:pantoate--beta-alanine ligase [Myxococcales bacterium]MCB9651820.1 pantoate--beta-alanine ligase [Deltaproteobacteria bacterium]
MLVIETAEALKAHLRPLQREGLRVGFVPTMGALHAGHLSLVEEAARHAEVVVVSIFVNPTQFGPNEDLSRYPRDLEGDLAKLREVGTSVVFHPSEDVMYPPGHQTTVQVAHVTQGLCGAHRPGHFEGVATVVAGLFGLVHPDVAVFGEKDYQQLTTIRTLVRDLHMDVEVVGAPLVRETDGLAMSSRNAYLSPEERLTALSLSRGLFRARDRYAAGERNAALLIGAAHAELDLAGVQPEYLELRHATSLVPLERADGPCVMLVAARVGKTRLIDNVILRRPS